MSISISDPVEDLWIFGYGSLIWKADFPYKEMRKGYIRGFQRKFFQNSIDHRGTPNKPGRVVTLVPTSPDDKVYGLAYKIDEIDKENVFNHLDYREKNGYEKCSLVFYPITVNNGNECLEQSFNVITYNANKNNCSYAGHLSDEMVIANQIYHAVGPSGPNCEYVYNLSKAMKTLFPHVKDLHLVNLENLLKNKETCTENK